MAAPPLPEASRAARSVGIALAVVLGVSVVGFLVGTAGDSPSGAPLRAAPVPPADDAPAAAPAVATRVAPTYLRLQARPDPVHALPGPVVGPLGPDPEARAEVAPEAKAAALERRAALRAFDGAPPMIPHPVAQQGPPECLACHAEGLVVRGRTASLPSHERFTSCTQCHAPAQDPLPYAWPPSEPLAANAFVGREAPREGERAWPLAPPTIPHTTFMREACASCHGAAGAAPLRTSHPWRQSCTQCHGPSAALDQAAGLVP